MFEQSAFDLCIVRMKFDIQKKTVAECFNYDNIMKIQNI